MPEVLSQIDLTVAPGEIFGLMGKNGAGKSTLLRILAGLIAPSSGRTSVLGIDPSTGGSLLGRAVGYVAGDERGMTPLLSPREHLAFYAALRGFSRSEALVCADGLLEEVGLGDEKHRPLRDLSTGMRRRAAFARGLIGSPRVLLLDEPTRAVDRQGAQKLGELLSAAAARGCTVVLATHDVREAEALCARVALLDRGRLVLIASPATAAAELERSLHAVA